MITLELTTVELASLNEAVATKIAILMNELVHADAREYKDYLRDATTRLEQLQRKLQAAGHRQPASEGDVLDL
jgi:hypothetical protein